MAAPSREIVLGSCSASWPWWILALNLVAAVVLGVVLGFPANVIAAVAVALSALLVVAFTSIRLVCRGEALVVEYGPLRWPRQRVALADIQQVAVTEIRPRDWGGWGYRGSRTLGKRAAIVLRRGPGLELGLRADKTLLISVEDPDEAVRLLRVELQQLS